MAPGKLCRTCKIKEEVNSERREIEQTRSVQIMQFIYPSQFNCEGKIYRSLIYVHIHDTSPHKHTHIHNTHSHTHAPLCVCAHTHITHTLLHTYHTPQLTDTRLEFTFMTSRTCTEKEQRSNYLKASALAETVCTALIVRTVVFICNSPSLVPRPHSQLFNAARFLVHTLKR